MNKTIKDYTDIELKAIKSDLYETISKCQNDLSVINQELQSRKSSVETATLTDNNKAPKEEIPA